MNSMTKEMRFRQSLMKYSEKYGVKKASRKYNKFSSYIYWGNPKSLLLVFGHNLHGAVTHSVSYRG